MEDRNYGCPLSLDGRPARQRRFRARYSSCNPDDGDEVISFLSRSLVHLLRTWSRTPETSSGSLLQKKNKNSKGVSSSGTTIRQFLGPSIQ